MTKKATKKVKEKAVTASAKKASKAVVADTVGQTHDEIMQLIDDVESDTDGVSRSEYKEFLQDLRSDLGVRLEALGEAEDE
jgi:hypothetical protein